MFIDTPAYETIAQRPRTVQAWKWKKFSFWSRFSSRILINIHINYTSLIVKSYSRATSTISWMDGYYCQYWSYAQARFPFFPFFIKILFFFLRQEFSVESRFVWSILSKLSHRTAFLFKTFSKVWNSFGKRTFENVISFVDFLKPSPLFINKNSLRNDLLQSIHRMESIKKSTVSSSTSSSLISLDTTTSANYSPPMTENDIQNPGEMPLLQWITAQVCSLIIEYFFHSFFLLVGQYENRWYHSRMFTCRWWSKIPKKKILVLHGSNLFLCLVYGRTFSGSEYLHWQSPKENLQS